MSYDHTKAAERNVIMNNIAWHNTATGIYKQLLFRILTGKFNQYLGYPAPELYTPKSHQPHGVQPSPCQVADNIDGLV